MEETENKVEPNIFETPVSNDVVAENSAAQTANPEPAIKPTDDKPQTAEQAETIDQINFRKLRIAKRKAEEERDELYARIALRDKELAEKAKLGDNKQPDKVENETEAQANRREIREIKNKLEREQERVRIAREEEEKRSIENQLLKSYPDLETVISQDNIELLKSRDANFAKMVNTKPLSPSDLYNRAISAYSLIKKYGIHVEDNHVEDRARVDANMSKPRPAAAASTTSEGLSDFAGFVNMNTEERRRAIFEMARKRANG